MKGNLEIRLARLEDAGVIAKVLAASFAEHESLYTAEAFAATTPTGDVIKGRFAEGAIWVAVFEENIVGTVSVTSENESLYIRSMAVLPSARGTGIGERLLTQIENFAAAGAYRRLFLDTTPFLHRAIRLYERCGFEQTNEPPHELYGTPLVTMGKNLPKSDKEIGVRVQLLTLLPYFFESCTGFHLPLTIRVVTSLVMFIMFAAWCALGYFVILPKYLVDPRSSVRVGFVLIAVAGVFFVVALSMDFFHR